MPQISFKLDVQKAKAAILYISSKLEDKSMHRIFKILYFAEKAHLLKFGLPITGDGFVAMQYGPVPSYIYDQVKICNNSFESNELASSIKFDSDSNFIYPTEDADIDEFSDSDIECLDYYIDELRVSSYTERTERSHDEAWTKARNSGTSLKLMPVADIALAAGAGEDVIKFIEIASHNSRIHL